MKFTRSFLSRAALNLYGASIRRRGKLDPIHKWVTDELRPYTKADATIDALKVNTGAIPPND
jgi:hypothetical protein